MDEKLRTVGAVSSGSLKGKKERNLSLDVIRILAFFLVVYTHFFLYTGYYKMDIVGPKAYIMTVVRSFGVTCIPLFIFLTGFLFKNKQLNAKYYSGIKNTLITYFFASAVCYIFDCLQTDTAIEFSGFLKGLLSFSSAKYSWYIEMYIGLFLLIPFLNIIWKNLPEKKHRILLILTLSFLTVAPQIVNSFVFGVEGWWKQPVISDEYYLILPEWWEKIFPLTYYFTGCYIREYGIKINKWLNLILIAVTAFGFGAYSYYRSTPGIFLRGDWQNNASPMLYLLGILVFVFILNLNVNFKARWLRRLCNYIAELTLGAYLVSCVFDALIYEKLKEAIESPMVDFKYILVTAPLIIILSLLTAVVINFATKLIIKIGEGIALLIRKLVPSGKNDKATAPVVSSRSAAHQKAVNPSRPVRSTAPVRASAPSGTAATAKPSQPTEALYKKRVNTLEDDAEEVVIVIEDKEYSAPVYQ